MKTLKILFFILLPVMLLYGKTSTAQDLRDTIVTKNNTSIICKITKITDADIEYKKDKETDAIIYVISKTKVRELHLANGKVELILPDEMDMNQEAQIIDKRSAIKFHFFSPFFDHLAVTYEKSIKMGLNLETTFGLINNSMFSFSIGKNQNLTQGATIVFGPKFILGHSFYIKGMKYSHPLKGSYFKPEIIFTSFAVRNVDCRVYTGSYSQYTNYISDVKVNGASLLLNYGNQFILGNTLTFGFNLGFGYSLVKSKYTNKALNNALSQSSPYYYSEPDQYSTYLFNQMRFDDNFPLVVSGNITLGYIFK
jgi:hypothetical protein